MLQKTENYGSVVLSEIFIECCLRPAHYYWNERWLYLESRQDWAQEKVNKTNDSKDVENTQKDYKKNSTRADGSITEKTINDLFGA